MTNEDGTGLYLTGLMALRFVTLLHILSILPIHLEV